MNIENGIYVAKFKNNPDNQIIIDIKWRGENRIKVEYLTSYVRSEIYKGYVKYYFTNEFLDIIELINKNR